MRRVVIVWLCFLLAVACFAQSPSAKWQVATIMDVKAHPPTAGEDPSAVQYDVTLRVGSMEYVVLYVPPDGTLKEIIQYRLGQDGLVLVGTDTIKYNDTLGRTREVSILRRRTIAANTADNKPEKKQ